MTESYYNEKPTMKSRTVWTESLLGQMRTLFRVAIQWEKLAWVLA